MANRQFSQFSYGLEKKPVTLYLQADGGGAGSNLVFLDYINSVTKTGASTAVAAPSAGFKGIKSITRNGDGDYTFTFQDNYRRLLGVDAVVYAKDNSTAPLAAAYYVKAAALDAAGGATIRVVTFLATIGTPVAPGTNDRWFFAFSFSDSNAV